MRGLYTCSALAVSWMCMQAPLAAETHAKVMLKYLTLETETESAGDELYFNVTAYASEQPSQHYQVPDYPTHWYSHALGQVTDVMLWEGVLQERENAQVIFSLTERDAPPWNVDDLLGSVKLVLHHENGQLHDSWQLFTERGLTKEILGDETIHEYVMHGAQGEYHVGLTFEYKREIERTNVLG